MGDPDVQGLIQENLRKTITSSPMDATGSWNFKRQGIEPIREKTGGRGRSRKRATLYNSLSSYHNKFLRLLTDEYTHEVSFNIFSSNGLEMIYFLTFFFCRRRMKY